MALSQTAFQRDNTRKPAARTPQTVIREMSRWHKQDVLHTLKDGFVLLGPNDVYVHDGTALRRTSPPLRIADRYARGRPRR